MRFDKNAKCRFFIEDCNELLKPEEMKPNQTTTKKPTFQNEFCSGKSKTTCSSGKLRGICYDQGSVENLFSIDYQRIWNDYGNKYVEYCTISINEIDVMDLKIKFINIGSCYLGKNKNFGQKAFLYYQDFTEEYDYSIFSDSYGEEFTDHSFCDFSSIILKNDNKKNIYKGFILPTCYEIVCSIKIKE